MSRYQNRRTRRNLSWARRPSLSARILGANAALEAANDAVCEAERLHAADLAEAAPVCLVAANDDFASEEPPFDPPDEDDDIFLGVSSFAEDDEAEGEFIAIAPEVVVAAPVSAAPAAEIAEPEAVTFATPPPAQDAQPDLFAAPASCLTEGEQPDLFAAPQAELITAQKPDPVEPPPLELTAPDEEPPFDAPDEADEVFGATFEIEAPAEPAPLALPAPAPAVAAAPVAAPSAPNNGECPAPPIQIHAAWDRPEIGELFKALAADHRLARADIEIARGGIDSAVVRYTGQASPNLIILDTTLRRAELLASLDRLAGAVDPDCKIIILGALNDIGLLRELALRGVSEYIVPPLKAEDLARAVCRLYAQNDQSRVIAVVGARGGVGASTIAHNLAWSIAERQDACAALVDLDLAFGAAGFSLGKSSTQSVAEALDAGEAITDEMLARAAVQCTKHLQVLTAPATLERTFDLDPDAVDKLVLHARRANPYVVLDLPHVWAPWVKQTLATADEVVIVAGPDLASLRNTKSMLEALAPMRDGKNTALVALNMVGVHKRPEINAKDFADAVGAPAAASIAFDPMLFGVCETKSQMVGEAEPESKAALALDTLAAALTGRKPVMKKRAAETAILARDAAADFAKSPKRGARDLKPADTENVLVLTRETSIGNLAASFAADPESEYLAKAREAAQNDHGTQRQERRRPFNWVRVGIAAGAAGLALAGGAWRAQSDTRVVTPAPAAALAAAPAAPAPATQYTSALLLLGEGRVQEARPLLQTAAEAGFAPAQHRLAKVYERGEGVSADPVLARAWTERAAANGNVAAMHDLGVYYAQSEAPEDAPAAFRWFRQAAEFGVADSQYNLGVIYMEGRGVNADTGEALFWFLVAAHAGDTEAGERARAIGVASDIAAHAQARAQAFRARTPNPAANAPA